MQEAKGVLSVSNKLRPIQPARLEQGESSCDIRANELGGIEDRAVDVALGSKMDNCTRPALPQKPTNRLPAANID